MSKFWVSLVVLVFPLLFGAGWYFGRARTVLQFGGQAMDPVRRQWAQITDVDLTEYERLKSAEDKYKKADEILGKMILLFLADLHLRADPGFLGKRLSVASPSPLPSPDAATQILTTFTKAENPKPSPSVDMEDSWRKLESGILDVGSLKDARDFLEKVAIKDLLSELKTTRPLSESQVAILNGIYQGEIRFNDPKAKDPFWSASWELSAKLNEGKVEGQQLIILSKNGTVFSRSRGEGSIKDFMAFGGDTSAILVNAYGDDGFMQLYYFPKMDRFQGNFYLKNGLVKYDLVGIVDLKRRR